MKPSDRYAISLCRRHHAEQHRVGELSFQERYALDLHALTAGFIARSPHRHKLTSKEEEEA